jgi:UDP-N-acetylglucosamine 2-epimerase
MRLIALVVSRGLQVELQQKGNSYGDGLASQRIVVILSASNVEAFNG